MSAKEKNIPSARILLLFIPVFLILAVAAHDKSPLHWRRSINTPPPVTGRETKNNDADILKELIAVYRNLDSVRAFYMEGTVQTTDPADSSNNMRTSFSYARDGERMYCRLDDQEMIALPDIYLMVNHGVKKVFISPPQQIIMPFQPPVDSLVHMLEAEAYNVQRSLNQGVATISLLRENHISCKEYTVSFDTATHLLQSVYMRLTNLSEPLNTKMDRTIAVGIRRWQLSEAPSGLFRQERWIRRTKNGAVLAEKLPGYELIQAGNN